MHVCESTAACGQTLPPQQPSWRQAAQPLLGQISHTLRATATETQESVCSGWSEMKTKWLWKTWITLFCRGAFSGTKSYQYKHKTAKKDQSDLTSYWCYYRDRRTISVCVWVCLLSVTLRRDAWERKNRSLREVASVLVRPPERRSVHTCAYFCLCMRVCWKRKSSKTREWSETGKCFWYHQSQIYHLMKHQHNFSA